MITWLRQPDGTYTRAGEHDKGVRHVVIEFLLDDGRWGRIAGLPRTRGVAVEVIERAIAKGLVRYAGYRLPAALQWEISEADRARLAALRARKVETNMAKKAKKDPKESAAGRKPSLAKFVSGPLELSATFKGKEFSAKVQADGMVLFGDERFTSPSQAAAAAVNRETCNGWTFWKFKKDGELMSLDALRGKSGRAKAARAHA